MKATIRSWTVWTVVLLAAGPLVCAHGAAVGTCTVSPGKSKTGEPFRSQPGFVARDSIILRGLLGAAAADLAGADDIILTIDSPDMPRPLTFTFPINDSTFKKGIYTSPKASAGSNAPQVSFKFNTVTDKWDFSGKNIDLTGLSCPMSLRFEIGDFVDDVQIDEDVVNGSKPMPVHFMMGIADRLQVQTAKPRFASKVSGDSFAVKGTFTTASPVDILSPLDITLGSSTWTVPAMKFTPPKLFCAKTKTLQGGSVSAAFDFAACTFTIQLSGISIEDYGKVGLGVAGCFTTPLTAEGIDLGPDRAFGLEELRRYDVPEEAWSYQSRYTMKGPGGTEKDTRPASCTIGDELVNVNDRDCYTNALSADTQLQDLYWYADADGVVHMAGWDCQNDLCTFSLDTDTRVMPSQLRLGQSFTDTGTFSGSLEMNVQGAVVDVSHLHGTVKSTCKFVRYERVSVPKGAFDAVRVDQTYDVAGDMHVYIADPEKGDLYGNGTLTIKINETWWGVPDVGVVKSQTRTSMKINITGFGARSLTITNTNLLESQGGKSPE